MITNPKLVNKINKISQHFNVAETIVADIEEAYEETIEEELVSNDFILKKLNEDYLYARQTVKEIIEQGKKVLKTVYEEIEASEEPNSDLVSSFAQLTSSINTSLKLLFEVYKHLLDTQRKIQILEKKNEENKNPSTQKNENHFHFYMKTTEEIISSFNQKKHQISEF